MKYRPARQLRAQCILASIFGRSSLGPVFCWRVRSIWSTLSNCSPLPSCRSASWPLTLTRPHLRHQRDERLRHHKEMKDQHSFLAWISSQSPTARC